MASEIDTLLDRHRDACLAKWATRMDWLERKTSDAEMDQAVAIEAKCREAIKALGINPERRAGEQAVIDKAKALVFSKYPENADYLEYNKAWREFELAVVTLDDAARPADEAGGTGM